ncbi:MAG TPA: glycogen-binding domain-containing protein [Verrucomicrobiae bacterium]|jgi:1,4-alpha-glucan branching enzyme|nr:glycogen-binding domain-containing protein [Verrucomicrobiae bacterium]
MNPQTITTRANAEHFGQTSANRGVTPKSSKGKSAAGKPASDSKSLQAENKISGGTAKDGAKAEALAQHEQSTAEREIQFRLEAPTAQEVLLAADFTNWDKQPIKLMKGGGGVWHAKLSVPPGRHQYRFVVDGVWQDDPHRAEREPNPYGSVNSVLEVH